MRLSRINSLLLAAIIVVNGYIIVMPLTPAVLFWFNTKISHSQQKLADSLHIPTTSGTSSFPSDNRLLIPSIVLDQPIVEGKDLSTLNKGTWRRPATSTPDKGGNTVIVGHRFTYTNPQGSFYYLNKLKSGDEIGVFWKGVRYLYRIQTISVVSPSHTEVEKPTTEDQLTLYTCTPLWLPKDRLVIVAILESKT